MIIMSVFYAFGRCRNPKIVPSTPSEAGFRCACTSIGQSEGNKKKFAYSDPGSDVLLQHIQYCVAIDLFACIDIVTLLLPQCAKGPGANVLEEILKLLLFFALLLQIVCLVHESVRRRSCVFREDVYGRVLEDCAPTKTLTKCSCRLEANKNKAVRTRPWSQQVESVLRRYGFGLWAMDTNALMIIACSLDLVLFCCGSISCDSNPCGGTRVVSLWFRSTNRRRL